MTKKELYDKYLYNRSEKCFTTFSYSFDYYNDIPFQINIRRFCVFMDTNLKVVYVIVINQTTSINDGIIKSLDIISTSYTNDSFEFDEDMLFAAVNPNETTIVEPETNTKLYLNEVGKIFIDSDYNIGETIFNCAKKCILKGCFEVLERGSYKDKRFTLNYKESMNSVIKVIMDHIKTDVQRRYITWHDTGNIAPGGDHDFITKAIYCNSDMAIKYVIVITTRHNILTSTTPWCRIEISDYTKNPIKITDNIDLLSDFLMDTGSLAGRVNLSPADLFDNTLSILFAGANLMDTFKYAIRHNILGEQIYNFIDDIRNSTATMTSSFSCNEEDLITKYSANKKEETENE